MALSEYELKRQQNIAENKRILASLGLDRGVSLTILFFPYYTLTSEIHGSSFLVGSDVDCFWFFFCFVFS